LGEMGQDEIQCSAVTLSAHVGPAQDTYASS
jgi:hypothetical protein